MRLSESLWKVLKRGDYKRYGGVHGAAMTSRYAGKLLQRKKPQIVGLRPQNLTASQNALIDDALAAGYKIDFIPDMGFVIWKGENYVTTGLHVWPSGTATDATVDPSAERGIRSFATMRKILQLDRPQELRVQKRDPLRRIVSQLKRQGSDWSTVDVWFRVYKRAELSENPAAMERARREFEREVLKLARYWRESPALVKKGLAKLGYFFD